MKKFNNIYYLSIICIALCIPGWLAYASAGAGASARGPIAVYRWTKDYMPSGSRPPYVAEFEEFTALKTNKYQEAFADLGQGTGNNLRITGDMTLAVGFQLEKQWPMRASLISKWNYTPGGASYDLGVTPDLKAYFRISPGGDQEQIVEIRSKSLIPREEVVFLSAEFKPNEFLALYINGKLDHKITRDIPLQIFDSVSPVRVGQRFEGLIGGVWFYDRAVPSAEIAQLAEKWKYVLPHNVSYEQWKVIGRKTTRQQVDYLGTTPGMKLVKEIDIQEYKGSYVCPGDLDHDGRIDFLLFKNASSYTTPGRLIAINYEGKTLWEFGDRSLQVHVKSGKAKVGQPGTTPALRGIATIYDIDEDRQSEVIAELWENHEFVLYILDGLTGAVEARAKSPIDLNTRQPAEKGDRQPTRSHPVIRIAHLDGKEGPPSIILKYGASNDIPCHAFALDKDLHIRWHLERSKNSMGHIPTVADVDGDGCDEIVLGHMLADENGRAVWDRGLEFGWHADTTSVMDDPERTGEKRIFISVCGTGPVYCLSCAGDILWSKTREEIEHGQAVWIGNFLEDNPGQEVIVCAAGHVGYFVTLDGQTGKTLATFEHRKIPAAYPDFPTIVNWEGTQVQSLWLPQDRTLVDGHGTIIAELGDMDAYVQQKLHCGTSWCPVGAQAFALDILGDEKEELILYEPYEGQSIFIFSNPDSSQEPKPYVPQKNAYNIRSYF